MKKFTDDQYKFFEKGLHHRADCYTIVKYYNFIHDTNYRFYYEMVNGMHSRGFNCAVIGKICKITKSSSREMLIKMGLDRKKNGIIRRGPVIFFEYKGEKLSYSQLSKKYNIKLPKLWNRHKKWGSIKKAIETPQRFNQYG